MRRERRVKKRLAVALVLLGASAPAIVAQRGGSGPPAPGPAAKPTRLPLDQRIAHTDPSRFRAASAVHGGPGRLIFFALFGGEALDTNLWFLHRGVIEPKSGIGAHFHNYCEEICTCAYTRCSCAGGSVPAVVTHLAGLANLVHRHVARHVTDSADILAPRQAS